jgi:DNA-binding Lrp family transcriptional regulator
MISTAVVLITCHPDKIMSTKKLLDTLPNVNTAKVVSGAYDLVVKITSSSVKELRRIIVTQIRSLSTVRSTLTLNVLQ